MILIHHGINSSVGGHVIPVEYEELEYIETRSEIGGASFYIQTGEFSNKDKEFSITFSQEYSQENTQRNFLYVGLNSSEPGFMFKNGSRETGYFYFSFRNSIAGYYAPSIETTYSDKCRFSVTNENASLLKSDGTILQYNISYSESTFNRMYIMSDRTNMAYNSFFGKLYNIAVSEIVDLKPVKRKNDNVLGLFDVINNTFYTAQNGQSNIFAGPIKMK